MAQSEILFGGESMAGNQDSVLVTHVESPVLFYCRRLTVAERVGELQNKIALYVDSEKVMAPDMNQTGGSVLVYSNIRNSWCRGRVLSCQRDGDLKPINAKVCLIDYGSIEIVLWNDKYVRASSVDIDFVNNGRGFCFPCALQLNPFDDGKPNGHQWSSYATFLIEKETKSRPFLLCILSEANNAASSRKNIVTCDLMPISEILSSDNQTFFSQTNFISLSSFLIESNVARFIDQDDDEADGYIHQSDDKENLFIANC